MTSSTTTRTTAGEATTTSTVAVAVTAAAATAVGWGVYQYLTYDHRWWWKRRSEHEYGMEVSHQPDWEKELIHGTVEEGWEGVREEFVHNFRRRGELGASVCIYYEGRKVVDLWGGYRDRATKSGWEKDTLCPIYSSSKGISAFALLMLSSRKKLDFGERIATYWPEFGQNGKQDVTVMDLIDHSVGLAGITPPITLRMLQHRDSKRIVRDHLAKGKMEWPNPGDYKGYMAINLGFYESCIVQLTEGSGTERTIGEYLHDEAFVPLGINREIYIGGFPPPPPATAGKLGHVATIDGMSGLESLWPTGSFPDGFISGLLLRPNSYTGRAFRNPQLCMAPCVLDYDRRDVQATEIPAANGLATARAVAKMYSSAERAINTDGSNNPLGLSPEALAACMEPAKPGRKNGWTDEVLGIECCMGAGFLKPPPPTTTMSQHPPRKKDRQRDTGTTKIKATDPQTKSNTGRFVAAPAGFGTPGAGGSFGYCDPEACIAYSYVMNRCGQLVIDDPREFALRRKMYEIVQGLRKKEGRPPLFMENRMTPHYLSQRYMDNYPELLPLSP